MRFSAFVFLGGLIVIFFCLSPSSHSGQIHTWTDINGVVHITDRPPPKGLEIKKSNSIKRPSIRMGRQQKTRMKGTERKGDASGKLEVIWKKSRGPIYLE